MARSYRRKFEHEEATELLPLIIEGRSGDPEQFRVGPLVEYTYTGMSLEDCQFWSLTTSKPETDSEIETSQEAENQSAQFRSIISTLDLKQDDQICGPMTGVFILTGGPGVGKTTVALHRIPYLINEQFADHNKPGTYQSRDDAFFKENNQLIIVWKKHLVPYLRECVHTLQYGFPNEGVRHVDNWVTETLRAYLTIGSKGWKMSDGNSQLEMFKSSFSEGDVQAYLSTEHDHFLKVKETLKGSLPKAFQLPLRGSLVGPIREKTKYEFEVNGFEFSIAGLESLMEKYLVQFPKDQSLKEFSETEQRSIRNARQQTRDAIAKVWTHLTKYDELLFGFYSSELATDLLANNYENFDRDEYLSEIADQRKQKKLTLGDKCLLLWLVNFITEESESNVAKRRPLTRYSHVLVDEAQYYDSRLLRLFTDLVDHTHTTGKVGVVTIVGDVEQRISSDGGVTRWTELDLEIPEEAITRLDTNYRWTPEVFQFIQIVHTALGVEKSLQDPRIWRVSGGLLPEITVSSSNEELHEKIVDRMNTLRNNEQTRHWRIVVITENESDGRILKDELNESGVEANWEEGENVNNSIDKVIITTSDHIVGLEFDAVFLSGVDYPTSNEITDEIKSRLWVALTRAKRFLYIARTSEDQLFSTEEFQKYSDN